MKTWGSVLTSLDHVVMTVEVDLSAERTSLGFSNHSLISARHLFILSGSSSTGSPEVVIVISSAYAIRLRFFGVVGRDRMQRLKRRGESTPH